MYRWFVGTSASFSHSGRSLSWSGPVLGMGGVSMDHAGPHSPRVCGLLTKTHVQGIVAGCSGSYHRPAHLPLFQGPPPSPHLRIAVRPASRAFSAPTSPPFSLSLPCTTLLVKARGLAPRPGCEPPTGGAFCSAGTVLFADRVKESVRVCAGRAQGALHREPRSLRPAAFPAESNDFESAHQPHLHQRLKGRTLWPGAPTVLGHSRQEGKHSPMKQ